MADFFNSLAEQLNFTYNLQFSTDPELLTRQSRPLPDGVEGLIGRAGDSLVIRLRRRKTHIFGDSISRSCTCSERSGVSIYVPSYICPIHVLLPWIENHIISGQRIFSTGIAREATSWLRIALAARDVPDASLYGLHSLRRGAARDLVSSGGDLPMLLRAGGWRSNAFSVYLDMVGLERQVITASVHALVDLDENEND